MDRTIALLAGAGVGAGLMYLLDPDVGRRRRARARDKAVSLANQAYDAARVVAKDASNKAQGVASGDFSTLVGGKQALKHPWRGHWSPSARALMGLAGAGLFAFGLTREAPMACVLGTLGVALAAEGVVNASADDLAHLPRQAADMATDAAHRVAEGVGLAGNGHRG